MNISNNVTIDNIVSLHYGAIKSVFSDTLRIFVNISVISDVKSVTRCDYDNVTKKREVTPTNSNRP